MDKFQNQYRIESARASRWDYSNSGFYFITICTHQRELFFGSVSNQIVILNEIGKIANVILHQIPQKFDFVILNRFVIMPNHIHVLIGLNDKVAKCSYNCDGRGGITGSNNPMLKNDLARVINWFKGRVTFEVNRSYPEINFGWQSRFHDRIIRNDDELLQKQIYIQNNPRKWREDDYFL